MAVAAGGAGCSARRGPAPPAAQGHHDQDGGAGLAADPHHEGPRSTSSYKAPSGNNVKLEVDFIPWPDYYKRLAASLTSGEQKYQMAVSDSQWLGAFVEGGYYRKINDFIDADPELQAIFNDLHPNLVAGLRDLSATSPRTTTASRRCRTC